MVHNTGAPVRQRRHLPMAVLPLLALLFVFVSSVSHHHAFSSRLDHGFVVTLDDLVVAGQSESLRVFARSDEGAASDDDYPDDTPWFGFPVASLGGLHPGGCNERPLALAAAGPSTPRYLVPVSRAPPLA